MNRMVIAAPHSGSGKTTVTLAIMAALKRRGLAVAPFKVGPDFIDPGYHRLATGAVSANLDGWMCGHDFVRETFASHTAAADIAVVEGVMGLFDGAEGSSDAGSTAEIAKLLAAPVILVVDAKSQTRSAAALVHGFISFDPALQVGGVIFNNVASENHERLLREAMTASLPAVAVIGCIPRDPAVVIPSRHLGLLTAEDNPLSGEFLARIADLAERCLDLDKLLIVAARGSQAEWRPVPQYGPAETSSVGDCSQRQSPLAPLCQGGEERDIKIAVARDAAFCFVYEDNLRLLREQGAELCFFSPLVDPDLPADISGIYLPGGYPELFAAALAANDSLKASIRVAVEAGMPVYGECGGFIYLTRGVRIKEALSPDPPLDKGGPGGIASISFPIGDSVESFHPFVGIFPVQTRMLPRRKALGYREVGICADSIIGGKGTVARGHEFHYSEMEEMPSAVDRLYSVTRKGVQLGEEGFRYKNCLASYIHLHFGSSPSVAESFVGHCRNYMKGSLT
jgi:cobyrinic acid a,c-diamide synthase